MARTIWGTLAWFVATLFVVYAFSLNTASAVFAVTVKHSLHLSNIQATYAVGAFVVGFACMQIPAGYLLDKYKARYIVSSGILLLVIGNVLISFANSLGFFIVANFIQGAGASFSFIAAGILIAQWFKPNAFPVMFGLTQTLSCILAGVIHYFLAQALQNHTWNNLYQGLAICGFVVFILSLIFISNPPGYQVPENVSLFKSLRKVCRSPQLWLCAIAAATSFGVLLAHASFWYLKIQKHYHVSPTDSLLISGLIFVGIGIGTPLSGVISNICQSRKLVLHVGIVLGVMSLLAGIYLPHFDIPTLVFIKTISFFIGLFLSCSMLFYTVVGEILPLEVRGVALSVTNTAVFLFNSFMLFLPLAFTASKTFYTSLWILPFCIMISILLLYFIKESYVEN